MKLIHRYLAVLSITLSSQLFAQLNQISVDSLSKLIPGHWKGIAINCEKDNKDSISLIMIFQDSSFTLVTKRGNKIISDDRGTFKIDSIHGGDYNITVMLTKKYPEHTYNCLSIGLQVVDPNKVHVSILECVFYKDTLHSRRYRGIFGFLRDFFPKR